MLPTRTFYLRLAFWLFFYAGVLPIAVPVCLDWLSRPSNWWLGWGLVGTSVLALGIGFSLYQAGRALTRRFLP
ncbi:hypothetical protein I2I05_12335 [Hymenobacter sp. BT683]|uniref:DUF4175 domain-containing protein n=1 Tax=Hymenobacter jeongseonensis TaxID=2791027 RepID=A0ABS0III7_9BACT|nr:hypothetical protein [Hymenobacter jeongseonensis]MBF9238184.1 hypothetical protein [Hymenobacter jeongseonensis]